MRISTSYHLLAFLGFAAVSVTAVPLSDISRTSVNLDAARQSLKSDSPHFTLTVHRTDDLVDEKVGTLVAERQVEIQMDFDVTSTGEENSLLLNGVPVHAGVTGVKVQVQAGMIINRARVTLPDGTVSEEKKEDVKSAFDVGLATIEIFVRAATMNVQLNAFLPPVPIRRFSLVERVTEINGKSVVQTDIGEQVFYFGPGGEFVGIVEDAKWADLTQVEESSKVASQSVQSPSMNLRLARVRSSFQAWFKNLPFGLRFLVGSAWATVAIFWGMFFIAKFVLVFRKARNGYKIVNAEKDSYPDEKVKEMEMGCKTFGERLPTINEDRVPGGGDSENDELCK